jgi:hypothetical protein
MGYWAWVALFGDHKPTDTLVGVEALSRPGYQRLTTRARSASQLWPGT